MQQGEGAIFQFHDDALERLLGFFVGNFQQLQDYRLVFTQHFARGDAKQQGVTDLAGGASDGDTQGGLGHECSP
ncbi:Uncharacterised protein [Bordetella pertussis]|nr:Uncharacterised protein [Bordetella pertussis]CPI05204.1 Uncharacterised protein [Bordetella pertussis]CPK62141.1 Uncharacterised protein [Bordetella pertussis]CPL84700.1 Uncharacterised protein [Bordetella pertussis]